MAVDCRGRRDSLEVDRVRQSGWRGCRGCRPGPPSRSRSAGPGRLQPAAAQVVAAFEVTDPTLTPGAVAGQPPAGAPGAWLGPSRDERPGRCERGQGLGSRAGQEPAVEGDLPWSKPQAVQLSGGLDKQAVLARVARCGRRRQQIAAGAATGVGRHLGQLGDIAELVGVPSLPLRIGRASGSASDTSRSLIFSPRCRCWIWAAMRWQRSASSSSRRAA
jgi:hypothetical protein